MQELDGLGENLRDESAVIKILDVEYLSLDLKIALGHLVYLVDEPLVPHVKSPVFFIVVLISFIRRCLPSSLLNTIQFKHLNIIILQYRVIVLGAIGPRFTPFVSILVFNFI